VMGKGTTNAVGRTMGHMTAESGEGAAAAPIDSGMNLPTSSFRSQDDASRAMISTIFLRIRRIWLVWA